LTADHRVYQRVKVHLAEARPRIAAELERADDNPLTGLHRRFEVVPGGQAQVDWGDEGDLLAHAGIEHVYSFHMTLSHSRDPFCCFVPAMDLATFFDCHRRAFAHFGGVCRLAGRWSLWSPAAWRSSWHRLLTGSGRVGRVQLKAVGDGLVEPSQPVGIASVARPLAVQGVDAEQLSSLFCCR
jgi:hypothetical protein